MGLFFYWSGVVAWTLIWGFAAVLAWEFARLLFWSAVFVRQLIAAGGWKKETPKWKRPWRFVVMTFRDALDPCSFATVAGKRVYHPLYIGERDDD